MSTQEKLFAILVVGYSLIILIIDYVLPAQISIGLLYILVIFTVSFLSLSKKSLFITALISITFITIGFFISPESGHETHALANRLISISAALLTCIMGLLFINYRNVESALKQQFSLAMNAATTAMGLINTKGIIVFSNKQMNELFGYKSEELNGISVDVLAQTNALTNHAELRERYMQNPETRKMKLGQQLTGKKKDGTELPLEIGLTPIDTPNGLLIVVTITDLTERNLHESKLKEEIREREFFSYSLSHDFRGFMRRIHSFSGILSKNLSCMLSERDKNYFEHIRKDCRKAELLVNDLETYITIGLDQTRFNYESLDSIIDEIIDNNADYIQKNKIIISYHNLPNIYGLHTKLYLLFANLILNAIKHNPSGTSILISSAKYKTHYIIEIKDNGVGIEKPIVENIFTLLTNVYPEKRVSGSGLGLAIVKNIVEQHSGRIWLESEVGKGSTFFIQLPVVETGVSEAA